MSAREDRVVRATTADGGIRVVAAITTGAVGHLGARAAALETAGVLLRELTGEDGSVDSMLPDEDVSSALMRTLRDQEIPAMASVVALPGPDGVRVAGGYVVQILPAASRAVIDDLIDHLGNLDPLATMLDGRSLGAAGLVAILMGGVAHALT